MNSAIEFKNVVKTFVKKDGGIQYVLNDVNFSIPTGKTTVIVGGSGQGKSVTLKLVLGLIETDSGKIFVHDKDVTGVRGRDLEQLRTQFGVLFQGSALFDSLTVFENVALPLRELTQKTEEEIQNQVAATLSQFELTGHEEKYPAQLSGGMKKRVGLARAMQLKPSIMLFDEPTTGLDPVMSNEIYHLFARTQAEFGFTSVIVSHDVPKIFNLADQIIILNNGKIDVFDSPEEIQYSEKKHIQGFVQSTMGDIYQSHLVE